MNKQWSLNTEIIFIRKDTLCRSTNQGDNWTWFVGPLLNYIKVLAEGNVIDLKKRFLFGGQGEDFPQNSTVKNFINLTDYEKEAIQRRANCEDSKRG